MERRAEIEFILACARGPLNSAEIPFAVPDEEARRHGLLPVVAWRMGGTQGPLRDVFRKAAARNLMLGSELVRLIGALGAEAIDALPLKGPALAFSVYEHFAIREFEDLDILVKRRRSWCDGGAHALRVPARFATREFGGARVHGNEFRDAIRMAGDTSRIVELHWGLQEQKFLSPRLGVSGWWDCVESTEIAGARVDSVPRRCGAVRVRAWAKHTWERLKWICDVSSILGASRGLDWRSC